MLDSANVQTGYPETENYESENGAPSISRPDGYRNSFASGGRLVAAGAMMVVASNAIIPATGHATPVNYSGGLSSTSPAFNASPASNERSWRYLFREMLSLIEEIAVEDGFSHPAEDRLKQAILRNSGETFSAVLRAINNRAHSGPVPGLLLVVGRIDVGSSVWRRAILSVALKSNEVEIRDSAIQLVELWGDASFRHILERHEEPVAWLDEYKLQVIEDLEADSCS